MIFLTTKDKMYLYNYYIIHGNFSGYYKENGQLYRKILDIKANDNSEEAKELSASEYVEYLVFPNRFSKGNMTNEMVVALTQHFREHSTLANVKLNKTFEGRLRRLAKKLDLEYKEFLDKLDSVELYPNVMNRVKNQYDIRAYNNLIQMIVFGILTESRTNKNIKRELLVDFANSNHMRDYEPGSYTYLENKVPAYGGPLPHNIEGIQNTLDGVIYYGVDCKLDIAPSILNDIIYVLKGHVPLKNLKPYTYYKLKKLIRVSGNLNRLGLDSMNLIEELEELTINLGYATIGEFLQNEGFTFIPVTAEDVDIIPCGNNYEVLVHNYDDAQITVDRTMKDLIEKSNIKQTLDVVKGPVMGQNNVPVLIYRYNDTSHLVSQLFTKNRKFFFKDGNTLNLTEANMKE